VHKNPHVLITIAREVGSEAEDPSCSAVEVLAQFVEWKISPELDKWILTQPDLFWNQWSRDLLRLKNCTSGLARRVLLLVKDKHRRLDPSVHEDINLLRL
jgi:hypothetical protein